MIEPRIEALREALRQRRFLEECLLHDLRLIRFGFDVDLVFNYVWTADDQVRADILEQPILIEFRLIGVQLLSMKGGLTRPMLENPDRINWGLSEIARVDAIESSTGLALSVRWEGERRLDIEFHDFELQELS